MAECSEEDAIRGRQAEAPVDPDAQTVAGFLPRGQPNQEKQQYFVNFLF